MIKVDVTLVGWLKSTACDAQLVEHWCAESVAVDVNPARAIFILTSQFN